MYMVLTKTSEETTTIIIATITTALVLICSKHTPLLAQVACIDTAGGTVAPPSQLHDPHNTALQRLLDPTAFPAPSFSHDPNALAALTTLGMRNHVSSAVLLDAARAIDRAASAQLQQRAVSTQDASKSDSEQALLVGRAAALLSELGSLAEKGVGDAALWGGFSMCACLPVLREAPHPGLPWPWEGGDAAVAPPSKVRCSGAELHYDCHNWAG